MSMDDHDGKSATGGGRESIWSVRASARSAYYGIFTAVYFSGLGFAIQRQFSDGAPVEDRVRSAVEFLGPFTIAAAAGTIGIVELGGQVMVLAEATRDWLNRRRERAVEQAAVAARAEGREEGKVEGRAEGRGEERAELLRLITESNPDIVIPDLPPLPETNGHEPRSHGSA